MIGTGKLVQFTALSSENPNGTTITNPMRYSHFANVMAWYFLVKFFIRIKYRAYELALIKTRKFPREALLADPISFPKTIKITAPNKPIKIPSNFFLVAFSFNKKDENIKTIIGEQSMITDALIGVVILNPLKKDS